MTEANLLELNDGDFRAFLHWLSQGGDTTMDQFKLLSREERRDVLDYLECVACCETIEWEDELFILVHAGIRNFEPMKELEEYEPLDFLWERLDYSRRYFPSQRIFLVTGHTPTQLIGDGQPLVYKANGHIAIDCGCVFGGNLAAYCIETGKVTYVGHKTRSQ